MPASPMCQPAGTGTSGTACMNYSECAEGFTCIQNPSGTGGKCQHFCCGTPGSGCPTGQSCDVQIIDEMGNPTGVGYCKLPDVCDPTMMMSGCGAGEGCYIGMDGGGTCIASTRNLTEGMTCTAANDCAPGLACYSVGTGGPQCYKYCDGMAMPSQCATGQTCNSLGLTVLPNLGICIMM